MCFGVPSQVADRHSELGPFLDLSCDRWLQRLLLCSHHLASRRLLTLVALAAVKAPQKLSAVRRTQRALPVPNLIVSPRSSRRALEPREHATRLSTLPLELIEVSRTLRMTEQCEKSTFADCRSLLVQIHPFPIPRHLLLLSPCRAMAVIQDLPPELLQHILDFLAEVWHPDFQNQTPHLASLALVARSWVEPGQRILHRYLILCGSNISYELEDAVCAVFDGLEEWHQRTGRAARVDFMELQSAKNAEDIEQQFQRSQLQVEEMDLERVTISASTLAAARTLRDCVEASKAPCLTKNCSRIPSQM